MRSFLRQWAEAPIAGTAAIVCLAGAIVSMIDGDGHGILLWLILGHLTIARLPDLENVE